MKVYVEGSFWRKGFGRRSKLKCKCIRRAEYGVYHLATTKSFHGRIKVGIQTNQEAEVYAIIHAIRKFHSKKVSLYILTDCLYAVRISEQYMNWLENTKGFPNRVKELFLWMKLCKYIPILTHVSGHSENQGNREAHRLAQLGMRMGCGKNCV